MIQKISDQCRCSASNAAEHRAGDAGGHPHHAHVGLVAAALARRDHVGDHRLAERQDAAAADALQAAAEDEQGHVGRGRAGAEPAMNRPMAARIMARRPQMSESLP